MSEKPGSVCPCSGKGVCDWPAGLGLAGLISGWLLFDQRGLPPPVVFDNCVGRVCCCLGIFFFPRLLLSTQSPSISSHTNKHPEEIFFHSPLRLGQSSSESPSALLISCLEVIPQSAQSQGYRYLNKKIGGRVGRGF